MKRILPDVHFRCINDALKEFTQLTPYNKTICKKVPIDMWYAYDLGMYEDDYRKIGEEGWYIYYAESIIEHRFIIRFLAHHDLDHCWETAKGDPTRILVHRSFLNKLLPEEYRGYVIGLSNGIL